jgi:hypothetical protein
VEVLPLDDRVRKHLPDALDEGLDEGLVGRTSQATLAVADVERVLEKLGVVRADVEADGQDLRGMDTCT